MPGDTPRDGQHALRIADADRLRVRLRALILEGVAKGHTIHDLRQRVLALLDALRIEAEGVVDFREQLPKHDGPSDEIPLEGQRVAYRIKPDGTSEVEG